jgi:hypothetical protein
MGFLSGIYAGLCRVMQGCPVKAYRLYARTRARIHAHTIRLIWRTLHNPAYPAYSALKTQKNPD